MRGIKKLLYSIFGQIIFYCSYLVPRSKKIWLFGAWDGKNYSDNSKYLFEYINKNVDNIIPVWITKSNHVVQLVNSIGYKAYNSNSIIGIFYLLRAKIGIICSSRNDLDPRFIGGIKLVQLWHGIPLKKIMFDDLINQKENSISKLNKFLFKFKFYPYSLLISTSPTVKRIFEKAFNLDPDKIVNTGYPRNDNILAKSSHLVIIKELKQLKNKKIGIYLPTFRDSNGSEFIKRTVGFLKSIDSSLKNLDTFLLVKLHHKDQDYISKQSINFINIRIISDNEIDSDIYQILPYMDFLISDYSSIYFDFLLTNKPIIFFPFDYDSYLSKSRELYFKYNNVTPGEKAYNSKQLLNSIAKITTGIDSFYSHRSSLRKKFYENTDSKSSERVYKEILRLISNEKK